MPAPKLKGARKATRYRAREAEPEKAFDRSQSRLRGREARMQTYDEVMELGGDEDQFHLNRDKMLLEDLGGNIEGYGDDDSVSDPDEIYSLNLPSRTKSPSPPPAAEKKPKERKRPDFKRLHKEKEDLTKKGRFGHEYDPMQDVVYPSSDEDEEGEEGASGSDDDEEEDEPAAADQLQSTVSDDDEDKSAASDDELDGDDRWAAAQYHATRKAPGEADSEDEEAAEMELEEARRLQRKARERLEGGDFGVEEDEDEEDAEAGGKRGRFEEDDGEVKGAKTKDEKDADLPPSAAASLSEPEAIAHLLRTSPETLALVDDFVLTASKVKQVEADLEVVRLGDGKGGEHPARAVMELEHQALTTYLPLLAFYFSLLLTPLSSRQASHDQIVESVLERLSSLRQSLATMEELELTSASYGAEEEEDDEEEEGQEEKVPRGGKRSRGMLASEALDFAQSLEEDGSDLDDEDDDVEEGEEITESMLAGLDDDEVEDLMASLQPGDGAEELMKLVRTKQREKGIEVGSGSGSEDGGDGEDEEMGMFDDGEEEEMEEEKPKKKAPKPKGIVVPTLAPSTSKPSKSSSSAKSTKSSRSSSADDYLDPLSLSLTDSLDKSTARKSLRFHVSQVAQKAAKREQRTRQGLEGDEDAPRRSKEAARRAVLQRQEHGAGKKAGESSRLDEGEFDAEDIKAARAVRGEDADEGEGGGGDDDDYYDLVSAEKAEGRKAKKARYDEGRAAEKAEILSLAESSVDGPRQATRQILANKGLTPKRKKENRNARVKKRLRYDKAQKKLGSMKASYKGGEGKEGYSGESGGITRRNVKSRKLG